jgi:hypothetical protein
MAIIQNDTFIDRLITILLVSVVLGVVYKQMLLLRLSPQIFLNILSLMLLLLVIALIALLFMKKSEKTIERTEAVHYRQGPMPFSEKVMYALFGIAAVLILFNQVQVTQLNEMLSSSDPSAYTTFIRSFSPLKLGEGAEGNIIGPQLNPDGRTTSLVEWPTISGAPEGQYSGDAQQDVINTVVPRGTPFYALEGPGAERIQGITFDDPIVSQQIWASLLGSRRFGSDNALQLTPEQEQRWQRLTGVFTCDFCCGGPGSVTTINRCGCAHSYAWQGMAKFFIIYYPEYTDEEILGEMTKWKALWYPKGMIQDYLVYTGQQSADTLTHGGSIGIRQQFAGAEGGNAQAAAASIDNLPSMVGGC